MTLRKIVAACITVAGLSAAQAAETVDAVVVGTPEIRDISADSDVLEEGYTARYRYCARGDNKGSVAGVTFTGTLSAVDPDNFWRKGMSSNYRNGSCTAATEGLESNSLKAILSCYYGSTSVNADSQIILRNLSTNHYYLVRFWCQHSDYSAESYQYLKLGGVTTDKIRFNTGSGVGQYATIKFRALTSSATLTISSDDGVTHTQYQAFELMELNYSTQTWNPVEGSVAWTTSGSNWDGKTESDELWSSSVGYQYNAVIGAGSPIEVQGDVVAQNVTAASSLTVAADASLFVSQKLALSVATNDMSFAGNVTAAETELTMIPSVATAGALAVNDQSSASLALSGNRTLTSLSGAGRLTGNGALTVSVSAGQQSFYGTMEGTMSLVKQGEGTLLLQGPNRFTGALDIQSGTLAIGPYADYGVKYHFDSSDTSKWTIEESAGVRKVTTLLGAKGGYAFNFCGNEGGEATIESSPEYFDGKPVLMMNVNSAYAQGGKVRAASALVVYQKNNWTAAGDEENVLFTSKENTASDKVRFGVYKKGYQDRSTWYAWNNSTSQSVNDAWRIYLDGARSPRKVASGKRSVLSNMGYVVPSSSNRSDQFGCAGGSFHGAIAEVIGFSSVISLEQRAAVEAYLMQKWNCDDKLDFQMLPKTSEVTIAVGATLDLGGLEQTVASLTGAGTVQNGALKATSITAKGGLLTIPAVEGQSYSFAQDDNGVWGSYVFTGSVTPKFVRPKGMKINATTDAETGVTTYTIGRAGFLCIIR